MKKYCFVLYFACLLPHALHADDATTFHRYLWANYNHFSGNMTSAQDWYKKIFSADCSLYTYKGGLNFLYDTKQFKRIIDLIPSLDKKFEKDAEVQLLFILALEKENQLTQADTRLIAISDTFKTNSQIAFKATQTYLRRKEPENALITINSFLNNTPQKPNNFAFYFFKSQIYVQLNKYNEALESINKCLEMHPQFDQGWLLRATLQEQKGMIKDAIAGYGTFLQLAGTNAQVEKHLYTLMLKHKQAEAKKSIFIFNKSSLENAQLLFEQKKYPQALAQINSHLEQKNTDSDAVAVLLKVEILSALNDFDAIANLLTTWTNKDPHNVLWPKTAYLLSHKNMPQARILTLLKKFTTDHPQALWPHVYYADLCIRSGDTANALASLELALPLALDDTLRAKIYHQLGLLHYEEQNFPRMLSALESGHTIDPHFPHLNNTLAYYWVAQGNDLIKAQALVDTALAHEKTNPYFLDTQAYILYKQKKYSQAKEILEPIAQHTNNATMLLHLAEIEYALGSAQAADTLIKKAEALIKNNHEKQAFKKMQTLLAINEK